MTLIAEKFVTTGMGWKVTNKNSSRNYRNHLRQFESFLDERGKTITDKTFAQTDIDDYIARMQAKGYKKNTIAVKTAAISSFVKWLHKEGLIAARLKIKSQPHELIAHKKVTQEMLGKIFGLFDAPENQNNLSKVRDGAMIALMLCGLKTEEIVALDIENIDFDVSELYTSRAAISFKTVHDRLRKYMLLKAASGITQQPTDPFFLNKYGKRITGRSLRRHLEKYIASSNSEKFSTRDLHWTWQCEQNLQPVKELY